MSFDAMLCVIAITGLIASFVAWRVETVSKSRWFGWGGLVLMMSLLVIMRLRMESLVMPEGLDYGFAFTVVLGIAASCLCWGPFVAFFLMHALSKAARSAISLDDIRIPPSYSLAEAAVARKDFREALRRYHETALEYPEEPEPPRRMGELFLLLNLPDDAIASFRDAQARVKRPEDQLPLVFRISEILADETRDVGGAIQAIEQFLSEHPEVEGRTFAEERLRKLRARTAKDIPEKQQGHK